MNPRFNRSAGATALTILGRTKGSATTPVVVDKKDRRFNIKTSGKETRIAGLLKYGNDAIRQLFYDHRLQALVKNAGSIENTLEYGIPQSSDRGWLRQHNSASVVLTDGVSTCRTTAKTRVESITDMPDVQETGFSVWYAAATLENQSLGKREWRQLAHVCPKCRDNLHRKWSPMSASSNGLF